MKKPLASVDLKTTLAHAIDLKAWELGDEGRQAVAHAAAERCATELRRIIRLVAPGAL